MYIHKYIKNKGTPQRPKEIGTVWEVALDRKFKKTKKKNTRQLFSENRRGGFPCDRWGPLAKVPGRHG